jgi:hypothetical protein
MKSKVPGRPKQGRLLPRRRRSIHRNTTLKRVNPLLGLNRPSTERKTQGCPRQQKTLLKSTEAILKNYYGSPAKDTAECKEIVNLLAERGVGVEAVSDCYSAAWEVSHARESLATAGPELKAHHEIIVQGLIGEASQRLSHKYGIDDPKFLEDLLKIKPTVFFGRYDPFIAEGEVMLNQ